MHIKISIIVPVYNVESYLSKCLSSIVNQTLKEIEIIAVNDGSTDNSLSILKKYSSIHKNIIIINKDNGGLSDARNVGIKNALGEYIAFVDSDDWIDKEMMFDMYYLAKNNDADIVFCSLQKVDEYDNVIKNIPQFHNLPEKINFKDNLKIFGEIENFACNKIFRKSLFKNIKFPKGLNFEDNATIPRIILNSKILAKSNNYYYKYFVRDNSISNSYNDKGLDMLNAICLVKKDYLSSCYANQNNVWKKFVIFQGFYCFLAYSAYVKDKEIKKIMLLHLKNLLASEKISKKEILMYNRFGENYLNSLNYKKKLYYLIQLIRI
ncbi:glycosyltransferase [Apibacter muscae]|uniref:Glycosyltransferase n=1 Tax=Apibacter muscae TaxID=2509004 RepID=A0A563D973_9FLAO|nr:glycosyltransferase [Apibacter muscae]TWP26756.1 glycosyltransferase [Apibacter muscae]TWP27613.1 glycosyltransferase [Apibacter muscae]